MLDSHEERSKKLYTRVERVPMAGSLILIAQALRAVERETWEEANRLLNTFSQETGWRGARRDRIISAFRLRAEAATSEDMINAPPPTEGKG